MEPTTFETHPVPLPVSTQPHPKDAHAAARGPLAPRDAREGAPVVASTFESSEASAPFDDEPSRVVRGVRHGMAGRIGLSAMDPPPAAAPLPAVTRGGACVQEFFPSPIEFFPSPIEFSPSPIESAGARSK